MMIYRDIIRSVLDWGCQVFHPLGNKEYTIMCTLRTVLGLMCTTPTNVILDLYSEYPLKARPTGWLLLDPGIGAIRITRAQIAAKEALLLLDSLIIAKCHYTNLYSHFKKDAKADATNTIKTETESKGAKYFNKIEKILGLLHGMRLRGSFGGTRPVIVLVSRLRSFHAVSTYG